MTQHSEAPWHYEISTNAPDYFDVADDFGTTLAQVERWNGDGDDTPPALEAKANARLIAAAPELLAAARDLNSCIYFNNDHYRIKGDIDSVMQRLDALFAKIEKVAS